MGAILDNSGLKIAFLELSWVMLREFSAKTKQRKPQLSLEASEVANNGAMADGGGTSPPPLDTPGEGFREG